MYLARKETFFRDDHFISFTAPPFILRTNSGECVMSTLLLPLVVVAVAVIVLFKLVRIVPQGYEWTVERWGKYTHTLDPGFTCWFPSCRTSGARST